jgi:hypothetical protein
MYGVNIHSLAATADMRFALSDLRIAARSAALAATREKTQEYLDGIPEITKRFENAARSYKAGGVTAEQVRLVDEAAAAYADYIRLMGTTLGPLALAKDYSGYITANDASALPLVQTAQADIETLPRSADLPTEGSAELVISPRAGGRRAGVMVDAKRDTPGRRGMSPNFSWHALLERSSATPTATVPRMSTRRSCALLQLERRPRDRRRESLSRHASVNGRTGPGNRHCRSGVGKSTISRKGY